MSSTNVTLQVKRGNEASLPTLAAGELAITLDSHKLFSNDGSANFQVGSSIFDPVGKSANYTVVAADKGKVLNCVNTITISLAAVATLGNGFFISVINLGSGTVTIDPNSSEQIYLPGGAVTTLDLSPNESAILVTNGLIWDCIATNSNSSGGTFGWRYTYLTDLSNTNPGTNCVKFDTTTLTAITRMRINGSDEFGNNLIGYMYQTWDKGYIRLRSVSDNSKFLILRLLSLVDISFSPAWANFQVEYISSSTAFANNDRVTLDFYYWTDSSGFLQTSNNLSDVASASTARTNLGLTIGTNVQAYDAELAAIAGLTSAADKVPYFTGSGTAGLLTLDTDTTLSANSDTSLASQKAVKSYTDNLVTGLSWKKAVRAATTANGTLSTAFANSQTIDGVTLATGDRILIKNQTTGAENGIYVVAASGSPSRATDADSGAELVNATVFVSEGTTNGDTQWTCTTDATITPGSTSLTFAQVAGAGTYSAGTGLTLTGNQFSISTGYTGQASITNLGTVTSGTWTGTAVAVANGGTGATSASGAKTNLGLAIGTDVEAHDATLTALAGFNTNGLVTQTTADTFTGRALTGTTGKITVTNGDGVSGNPTVTIDSGYVGQSSITTLGTVGTGTWQGTAVGTSYGGTGATSANAGLNALLPSQTGNSGKVLQTDGAGNTSWQATTTGTVTSVTLTAPSELSVSGSPVTSSGTLALSWANESANTVLAGPTTGSAATPAFRALVTADFPANGVTNAKLRQSAGLSVIGNSTNATANVADITAGSDKQVLRRSGTAIGWGAIDVSSSAAVSGIMASSNGGTGNGFSKFSGPASTEKTFTLPNASDTIGCLGQDQTWTGANTFQNTTGIKIVSPSPAFRTALALSGGQTADRTLTFAVNDNDYTITLNGSPVLVTGTMLVNSRQVLSSGLATGGGSLVADRTITVTAATQSDQETATSTTTAITPSVQQYHPSACKAWVRFDGTGTGSGTQTVNASYNVSGVTRNSVGDFTVTFTTAFSSVNYAVVVNCKRDSVSGVPLIAFVAHTGSNPSTSTVRVQTQSSGGTSIACEQVHVVCYGDQ